MLRIQNPEKKWPQGARKAMRGLAAENLITSQCQSTFGVREWGDWKGQGGQKAKGGGANNESEPRQRHIFHINEMLLIVHLTLVKCDLIVSANAKGQDTKRTQKDEKKRARGWRICVSWEGQGGRMGGRRAASWAATEAKTEVELGCVISWRSSYLTATLGNTLST